MDFSAGSSNMNQWRNDVIDYNPTLLKEINRLRSLYDKAVVKQGKGLSAQEHFAVIAIHAPELTTRKGEEYVACRCTVTWEDGDYQVDPITRIVRKKKKQKPQIIKKKQRKLEVVKKKKTQVVKKKVRKKRKRTIVL